jgi:hypothetical protein
MGKKLLSKDYDRFVFETFELRGIDFYKHYYNVVKDNISDNSDVFQELISAVNRWIEWYKDRVNRGALLVDENGRIMKDKYTTFIPLFPEYGIFRSVDLAFFENHLRIIEDIERQEKQEIKISILERISANLKKQMDNTKPKRGRKVKPLSYKGLFMNPAHPDQVKEILEKEKITKNYKYVKDPERSNNDSELLAAFYVLEPLFINHDKTPAAKCFYNEFDGPPLSDRMMSNKLATYNKDRDRFIKMFSPLFKNN